MYRWLPLAHRQAMSQAESVHMVDAHGDGRHVSIDVVSSQFEGKNSVKRQQAVYKAIWLELQVGPPSSPFSNLCISRLQISMCIHPLWLQQTKML